MCKTPPELNGKEDTQIIVTRLKGLIFITLNPSDGDNTSYYSLGMKIAAGHRQKSAHEA